MRNRLHMFHLRCGMLLPPFAAATLILCHFTVRAPLLNAQTAPLDVPSIAASTKGPNQINLTWPPVPNPGYGYLVEIQSDGDPRYSTWTELSPVPRAAGYTCDSSVLIGGGRCTISDSAGSHVYNPPTNGVPYWVTEPNYTDPQDDSPAQFISWGLRRGVSYSFRVRTYSGTTNPVYGPYSNRASATTANYTLRYVSPTGNDSNDGTGPDNAHAWRTLSYAAPRIGCGQELIVMGGDYANEAVGMQQQCSADSKAVLMVNPGDTATITSMASNAWHLVMLFGSHIVIDGLRLVSPTPAADTDIEIQGNYNALLNVEMRPLVIPSFKTGLNVTSGHNLVYRSALHDYGSPDAVQNPNGNGGYVLGMQASTATNNVIWSNHLTRGGHDVSLCIYGCSHNRWLNNVMDGGWGMGWEVIGGAQHNLLEGNVIFDVGQLVSFYKPAFEVSSANNTARRNVVFMPKTVGLEVSDLDSEGVQNVLVYNNTFYKPGSCYFQSPDGGVAAYDGHFFVNNICHTSGGAATDIFQGNTNSKIAYNSIAALGQDDRVEANTPLIIWNHNAGGSFQFPKTVAFADANYSPPFSQNAGLDVDAKFVDATYADFHLLANSPLIGAGKVLVDSDWGTAVGGVDLGAYGIHSVALPLPSTQISTTASGLAYSRVSQTFNGTVTLKNISNSPINGPFQIVFGSLTAGVTLASATGSFAGMPYLTLPNLTSLAPGQSATVSVQFRNPSNVKINFTPLIYSGSIN